MGNSELTSLASAQTNRTAIRLILHEVNTNIGVDIRIDETE